MLTLVLIKIAADLALYYTFAGAAAAAFGASGTSMLLALAVQVAAFGLCYAMRQLHLWRFLPLALPALYCLAPGLGVAGLIAVSIPLPYECYLVWRGLYVPEWAQQARIFSVFWKWFLALLGFCIIAGGMDLAQNVMLPFGGITLLCCVLLMRALRHDPQVYCQTAYQAVNLLLLGAVGGCALFLSSSVFLNTCMGTLQLLYSWIIDPLLMVLSYLLMILVKGILWLLSLFHLAPSGAQSQFEGLTVDLTEGLFEPVEQTATPWWLTLAAAAVGIGLVAAVLIHVFRALAERGLLPEGASKPSEAQIGLARERSHTGAAAPGTPVARVRAQYRKFLKLAAAHTLEPAAGDTSLDISRRCQGTFDEESVAALRQLYLEARYRERASREDAQQAKALYTKIKKQAAREK